VLDRFGRPSTKASCRRKRVREVESCKSNRSDQKIEAKKVIEN
jgi:hypothetical protein